ncbi:MAG: hypothetical protein KF694_05925 [Mesorhizobium sp.]|nr:hypothetical protein [Mesorhizobium sp.]
MKQGDTPRRNVNRNVRLTEGALADERMGKNSLQGNDQSNIQNQRYALPDEKDETEDLIESFENLDPQTRAERDRRRRKE